MIETKETPQVDSEQQIVAPSDTLPWIDLSLKFAAFVIGFALVATIAWSAFMR